MEPQENRSETSLSEVFSQACESGKMTPAERQGLQSALLDHTLSEEEQATINRLLYAVRRGWLDFQD